jgi:hypothetical protein
MQYFYDSQCRKFLTQFGTIFSLLDVQFGSDQKGNPILRRVPVMYGDMSRQAAAVLNQNSASTMPTVPMISYYVSGMEYDQRRTQEPYYIDKSTIRQRSFNRDTGQYESVQGNAFTVERPMPVPYTMRVTVDIWTSSSQQKFEIFEQLGSLFNPSLEIQSTDNYLDWTSLSVVYQDGLNWTSRSVPQGTGNPIDITSWKFYMPIWISSPIKVSKLGLIQKVIASIYKGSALVDMKDDDLLLGTRQKITPYGYQLLLVGNKLQILPASLPIDDNTQFESATVGPNTEVYWHSILNAYGKMRPGVSQIALENEWMETEIIGTIDYDTTDDRLITYTIDTDTLPSDTLDPVDMIIDPHQRYPDNDLPVASVGQRYLIISDIPYQQYLGNTPDIWDSGTTYSDRDVVLYNNVIYISKQDNNTNNSPDSLTAWREFYSWEGLTTGARANDIIEFGAITFNVTVAGTQADGTTSIVLQDASRMVSGYTIRDVVATNGLPVTVTSVDYNSNTITIDTGLTEGLVNAASLRVDGNAWFVSFDNNTNATVHYVTNNTTGIQYRWNSGTWRKCFEGYYDQGSWRIII